MDNLCLSLHCEDDNRKEELRELLESHNIKVRSEAEAPYQLLVDEPLGWASLEPHIRPWNECIIMSHNRCPAYQLDLLELKPAALLTSTSVKVWLQTLIDVKSGCFSRPQPVTPLTPAERQTLRLLARGHTNDEIASLRGIKAGTVKNVLSTIYQKLHLRSRVQAALYYYGHWHLLLDWSLPPHLRLG